MSYGVAYQQPVVFAPVSDYLIQVGYAKVGVDSERRFIRNSGWMPDYVVTLPTGRRVRDTTPIYPLVPRLNNDQMQHLNNLLYFIARRYHQCITARVIRGRELVVTGTQPLDTTSESIRNYKNGVGPVREERFSVSLSSIPASVVETLTARNAPTTPAGLRDPLIAALLK